MRVLLSILFITSCSTTQTHISSRIPSTTIETNISNRTYPSIFQAWQPVNQEQNDDPVVKMAQHDLVWQSWSAWGLKCSTSISPGLCDNFSDQSITDGLKYKARLKELNPNIILLAEIRYHDAVATYLPDNSVWWKRDANGNRVAKINGTSTVNYFLLDFNNLDFQDRVASLCRQVVATGIVDGCMFDWWNSESNAHVELIKKVRAAVGDSVILIANVNGSVPTQSAPFLNGIYMEGFGAKFFNNWQVAKANLIWAQSHFQKPVITALDAWGDINSEKIDGKQPLALSLVFSDGYFLFGNQLHQHKWQSVWSKKLGKPIQTIVRTPSEDGVYRREFEHGTVVFNPPENKNINLQFPEMRESDSVGDRSLQYILQPGDADIYLK